VKNLKKDIAQKLSKRLDMFYADVADLMEYNFINDETIKVAGQQYFDKLETDFLKKISEYENSVFALSIATINKNNNLELIKKGCLLVFIKLKYEDFLKLSPKSNKNLEKLDQIMYDDRTKLMQQYADIVVIPKKLDALEIAKDIIINIKKYYKY
jgi:shikimate kinase